ncbi:MAG: hypothetical protein ACOYBQ_01480 [Fluviibacter sp.]|jgi:hypothetical protein
MSLFSSPSTFLAIVRAGCVLVGLFASLEAMAQTRSAPLPPQVVTYDPALTSPEAEAEEEAGVTITPDDRSTSIRSYGSGGQPSRVVVTPPILPSYSESPEVDPQSVMPESDPVRGDMVQPPMWTLWSW